MAVLVPKSPQKTLTSSHGNTLSPVYPPNIMILNFQVEKVLGVRQGEHGQELLVRWKGFEPADDTWEREEFLPCQDLITKFLKNKRVGHCCTV